MLSRASTVLVRAVLCAITCQTVLAAQGDVATLLYNTLQSQSSVAAMATATLSSGGAIEWSYWKAAGAGNRLQTTPMDMDRCYRMNTMGELLVIMSALQLIKVPLYEPLNTSLTPGNLRLYNPNTVDNVNITYKDLMQHTSGISDNLFATTVATSLSGFVTSYFVQTSTATPQLNSAAFGSLTPGQASSYSFARANTALLAYILETMFSTQGLPYTSLEDYISQNFLVPFGMSSTFFLTSPSSFPGITPVPKFSGVYVPPSDANFTNSAFSAAYFYGCVVDSMATSQTFSGAIYPDYNGYTTLSDTVRFLRALFYNKPSSTSVSVDLVALLNSMKDSISVSATSQRIFGQKGQGYGLMYFNGDSVCQTATSTGVVNACPVSNLSTIIGYVTSNDYVENGFLCADTGVGSRYGVVCTATVTVYASSITSSSTTQSSVMSMFAVISQDLIGTVTVPQAPTDAPSSAQTQSQWFGVYSFLGVYLSLLAVYFGSLLIQWMFQPAALAQATDSSGAAALAYGGMAAPQKEVSIIGRD